MRLLLIFIALAATAAQQPPAQPAEAAKPSASIEGRLTDASTGEPVRKALVMLLASNPTNSVAESDAEGKFAIRDLDAGSYRIFAEKTGYIRQSYGVGSGQMGAGTPIAVKAGQKITGLDFKLTRQGVISGRVLDEDGEPVQYAMVSALRQMPLATQATAQQGIQTNDSGEFRISGLPPGKYFLRAEYRHRGPQPLPNPEGVLNYVGTFYPGTTELTGASPIILVPGQQASGMDIPLRKARTFQVSGKVAGLPPDVRVQLNFNAAATLRSGYSLGGGASLKPDGSFLVSSLLPGTYDATIMSYESRMMQVLGRSTVVVANRNVENVIVQVTKPVDINGRIVVDGEGVDKPSGQIIVSSLTRKPLMVDASRIQTDGTFKFTSVPRDSVVFSVIGLPDSLYVSGILSGGVDVTENGLDLSASGSTVDVEARLRPKAAIVEGVVRDSEGKPAPGCLVTILPDPFDPERPSSWLRRGQSTSDQNGKFSIKGLAPGEYRLYAWNVSFINFADVEPERLKPYEKNAGFVKLKESAKEQADLKLNILAVD